MPLTSVSSSNINKVTVNPLGLSDLVTFWDFQSKDGGDFVAAGPHAYRLSDGETPVQVADEGVFGPRSAFIEYGQWLICPREACPALDIHGKDAAFTVVAWVKRMRHPNTWECQAIAGMWEETRKKRQYCLFLDLRIHDSAEQVCGHISSTGGSTPGFPYAADASIGATPVPFDVWQTVAISYDGAQARSYLNGRLDSREGFNPYPYDKGIYSAEGVGADFTVGAVNRFGNIGNLYHGLIGGLAVYTRALDDSEILALAAISESGA